MRPRSSGRIVSFFLDFGEIFTRIRGLFEVETTFVRAGAQGTAYLVRIDSTRGAWTTLTIGAARLACGIPGADHGDAAGRAFVPVGRVESLIGAGA